MTQFKIEEITTLPFEGIFGSINFLSDGRLIRYYSGLHEIWDLQTGVLDFSLPGNVFLEHPDKKEVIVSNHEFIIIYDMITQQTKKIRFHDGFVNDIIYISPGIFASCSDDNTIKVWSDITLQIIYEFTDEYLYTGNDDDDEIDTVERLLLLPDSRIASYSTDNTISIWNLKTFKLEKHISINYEGGTIQKLKLIKLENGYGIMVKQTNRMSICDMNECILTTSCYTEKIIPYTRGKIIMSNSSGISIINIKDQKCDNIDLDQKGIVHIELMNKNTLIICYMDKSIKIVDIEQRKVTQVLEGHIKQVWSTKRISPHKFVTVGFGNMIIVWNS